ncbi:MAG: hypothetical protein HY342_00860 [Candidatus Lambdaproteobacteria bacterium]|nr:hypothetical protein [Candidatus Lambdaproteobacteria bacterium]
MSPIATAFLDSMSTPLMAVDRAGDIVFANTACAQFWKATPERMREYNIGQLFGADNLVAQRAQRAIADEAASTINAFQFNAGEGAAPIVLRIQIDPLNVPGEPLEHALLMFWDQTHQLQLEAAQTEQQLMESIGFMVRRLAHELQNPLSGIKGATQLLARQARKNAELREFPDVILRELERLERLVKALLQHGGDPPLAMSRFNLHELLDTVIWFQSNSSEHVRFERLFDPSLPDIEGDRDRLHQVFLNLIRNAADASPPNGTVRVCTRTLGPWRDTDSFVDGPRIYFQIEIIDEGAGISPEHMANLFTPFFTTKKQGHGLGLSLCYQIVRAHGGQLRYQKATPTGAAFVVNLPLVSHSR